MAFYLSDPDPGWCKLIEKGEDPSLMYSDET